jgi:hypothetical protein
MAPMVVVMMMLHVTTTTIQTTSESLLQHRMDVPSSPPHELDFMRGEMTQWHHHFSFASFFP